MKKLLVMFIAFVAAVTVANAQTVESSRLFENTYVGVQGGVLSPLNANDSFWGDLRPVVGLELGKDFTPVIGFSVEALGAINTTGAHTWFDQSNVNANFKVNLSNWFGGYKGQPRRVEVLAVPSLGWGHDYVSTGDANYLTFNPHAQVNINLGKARAWQINVKPGMSWRTQDVGGWLNKDNAAATLRVGITYKFGSKRTKSHNFVVCPYTVTKADYDAALAEAANLRSSKPQTVEVTKEVPVEKVVEKAVEVVKPSKTIITFDMGKATLKTAERAKVKEYASHIGENDSVLVIGSADLKTGSLSRNQQLAEQRAEVVANALKDLGVKNVETKVEFDTNEVAEASRAAVLVCE